MLCKIVENSTDYNIAEDGEKKFRTILQLRAHIWSDDSQKSARTVETWVDNIAKMPVFLANPLGSYEMAWASTVTSSIYLRTSTIANFLNDTISKYEHVLSNILCGKHLIVRRLIRENNRHINSIKWTNGNRGISQYYETPTSGVVSNKTTWN